MTADIVNAVAMFGGFIMNLLNCRRILIDKTLEGCSVWPAIYFSVWGVWGVYYLGSLNQWFSTSVEVLCVTSNVVWFVLAWRCL